jgi:hypothetical protein
MLFFLEELFSLFFSKHQNNKERAKTFDGNEND